MNKLEYYSKILYIIKPSTKSERYKEIVLELIESLISQFIESIQSKEIITTPIVLNLKEIAYFDLVFEFSNKSNEEKAKLFDVYSHIIKTVGQLLSNSIQIDHSLERIPIESFINSFVSYTQFWNTRDWNDDNDSIEKLTRQHKNELVKIGYTIMYSIIMKKINEKKGFKICEKLFDIVGFVSINELLYIHFEEVITASDVHRIRLDEIFFPTLFLLLEFHRLKKDEFDRLFTRYIRAEEDVFQHASIMEAILNTLTEIEDEEIP